MVVSKALLECSAWMISCKKVIQFMEYRNDFHRCIKKIDELKDLLEDAYRKKEKVFVSLGITKDFDNEVASLFLLR
jgi:hypothetical protein